MGVLVTEGERRGWARRGVQSAVLLAWVMSVLDILELG